MEGKTHGVLIANLEFMPPPFGKFRSTECRSTHDARGPSELKWLVYLFSQSGNRIIAYIIKVESFKNRQLLSSEILEND